MEINYYQANVYKYGDIFKVVYIPRFLDSEGRIFSRSDCDQESKEIYDHIESDEEIDLNEKFKYECNLIRAKGKILEYALCNPWDWFVTFTLDKEKYDRFNLDLVIKDLTQYFRDQRKQGYDIKYLLVPEHHKDGAWHIHGLIKNINLGHLKIADKTNCYDFKRHGISKVNMKIFEKFGLNTFDPPKSTVACSMYVGKYILKGLKNINIEFGSHLYFASNDLAGKEKVYEGEVVELPPGAKTFEWCSIKWVQKGHKEILKAQLRNFGL